MGANTSCLADSQIVKNNSLNMEIQTERKKIHPLKYIEPLGFSMAETSTMEL